MPCFWTDLKNTSCVEVIASGNPNFKGTGLNDQGQLGLGHTNPVNVFTDIPLDNVVKMSMGYKFAMAIDSSGILYGTGLNDRNQLTSALPGSVNTWTAIGTDFLDIQCGFGCAIGIKTNGDVMRVGQGIHNGDSFLGATIVTFNNPVFTNINGEALPGIGTGSTPLPSNYTQPLQPGFSIELINKADYPLAILQDNNPSGGGGPGGPGGPGGGISSTSGQIGFATGSRDGSIGNDAIFYASVNPVFKYISGDKDSKDVADYNDPAYRNDGVIIDNVAFDSTLEGDKLYCGDDCIFAITSTGDLYGLGTNLKRELGIAGTNYSTFQSIGSNFVKIVPAPFTTFALKTDGDWYAVGRNVHGNMGLGDTSDRLSFANIGTFSDVSAHNSDTLVMV